MSAPLFIMAPAAPTPVAPFCHAVEVDSWCFIAGQMPTYPEDDSRPLAPDIESQTVWGVHAIVRKNIFPA